MNDSVVLNFLASLSNSYSISEKRWGTTADDIKFFNSCVSSFKEHGITSLLDIGTGIGNLVKIAQESNIDSYGLDPILFENHPRLFCGTMGSVIKNQDLLGNYRFSCISCVNFLHGTDHVDDEVLSLFAFMKKFAEFVLITQPRVSDSSLKVCMEGLVVVKTFERSHGGAYHTLYKVANHA